MVQRSARNQRPSHSKHAIIQGFLRDRHLRLSRVRRESESFKDHQSTIPKGRSWLLPFVLSSCDSRKIPNIQGVPAFRPWPFARRFSQRSRVAMAWFSRPFARISSAHARFSGEGTTPSTALATASMKNVETPICLCRLLGLCPARVHQGTVRPAIAVRTLATSSIGGAQFTIMHSGFRCTFIFFPFIGLPGIPGGVPVLPSRPFRSCVPSGGRIRPADLLSSRRG